MSSPKNTSLDGKPMTDCEMKMAMDWNIYKRRKIVRVNEYSWVSFDEKTMKKTTEGQSEVTTDGHTTLTVKGGQMKLIINGKTATFVNDGLALTPTAIDDWTTSTTEGQETATGQATTSDGRTTATTTDGRIALSVEQRLECLETHRTLFREGRDMLMGGQTTVMGTDGQTTEMGTDGQTTEMGTDGQTTIAGTDERLTATVVEEMVVEVDPLALSPATSAVDPLALSPAPSVEDSLALSLSAPVVAGSDSVISHYSVEETPLASPVKEVREADDGSDRDSEKIAGGIGKRVAGRREAVVVDDESDTAMSIVSVSSEDEDNLMAASSSRSVRSKGVKRGREPVKMEKAGIGSNEEGKGKKKGKKKVSGRKDTPEEEENVGRSGEPKGVVDHVLEDMSSSVLGGAIQEWANSIEDARVKCKNIQGKLSGEIKRCVAKIIEGTALLVARSEATGDPQFLRMRNSELMSQLREAEGENARLQEQLRKNSPGISSPPRKKKKEKVVKADMVDTALADMVDTDVDPHSREEFPPLPQRTPRAGVALDGNRKKTGPRILSDVQVAPPFKERRNVVEAIPAVPGLEAEWRVAAGSRRRGRVKGEKPPPPPPLIPAEGRPPLARRQQPKVRLPRPPVSTAVTITGRTEGFSYAEAMRNARERINLESLGITTSRVRNALNGGLLIEVSGEGSKAKAEELVVQLRNVLGDSVAVSCPVKKRELTVVGFGVSVTAEEIAVALSDIGGCPRTEIKMGPIRNMSNGLGMIWVQLPVAAAAKAAEEGRIRVGWTMARVELLKVRPLQCYKCWSFGHVQTTCHSVVDRRGACFRCGQKGHMAGTCTNPVHCAVCHDAGLEASHRLGGPQCAAQERQAAKK